jgi:hypothetical protein
MLVACCEDWDFKDFDLLRGFFIFKNYPDFDFVSILFPQTDVGISLSSEKISNKLLLNQFVIASCDNSDNFGGAISVSITSLICFQDAFFKLILVSLGTNPKKGTSRSASRDLPLLFNLLATDRKN